MIFLNNLSLAYFLRVFPFDIPKLNRMEAINETLISWATFCLIAYSDFVVEPHMNASMDMAVTVTEI